MSGNQESSLLKIGTEAWANESDPKRLLAALTQSLDVAPMDESSLLELFDLGSHHAFRPDKWRVALADEQERVLRRCLFDHGGAFSDPDFAWMLVEVLVSEGPAPQQEQALQLVGWVLGQQPNHAQAFRLLLDVHFEDPVGSPEQLHDIAPDIENLELRARYLFWDSLCSLPTDLADEFCRQGADSAAALGVPLDRDAIWAEYLVIAHEPDASRPDWAK